MPQSDSGTTTAPQVGSPQPRRRPGYIRALAGLALCLVLLLGTIWAAAALYFDFPVPGLRTAAGVAYLAAISALWLFLKRKWLKATITFGLFAFVLGWWLSLLPSNSRDWQPDLALLAYAEFDGDRVTVRNIRDCDYRSETDFDVRYHDSTVDLRQLVTADLFMVYWGSPHMAHTMVSFGFEDGQYLCFSIETRKEKGEGYSAIKGLFRQFELIYVVADERDVVRLRTNYRQDEEVYLFRLRASPEQIRDLFLAYVAEMNRLRTQPQWYNALTHNCSTSIRMQRATAERAPLDWRMLANGHGDELFYEYGVIATNLPLSELKRKSHINQRARATSPDADFSQAIRLELP